MHSRNIPLALGFAALLFSSVVNAQMPDAARSPQQAAPKRTAAAATSNPRPKLVVIIVVDQMRGDYVDKFRGQWTGGLKRLIQEGAWFRDAAYPYAATETCVGHSTISTGAFPATSGIVANAWWDRDSQKMVTCTSDPNVKNTAYAGGTSKGGDSAWRFRVPAFSDELRFQSGGATRVVAFSLKARAAISLGGHKADAVTWFENGSWVTSTPYGSMPYIENYLKANPAKSDYGKTWDLSMPKGSYFYDETATGAVGPEGWNLSFPHKLTGKAGSSEPDDAFWEEWETSPYADTYLTRLAELSVDQLGLGKSGGTDFLGISYSSPDYVGHSYGPRSWEIQDVLIRLDRDLGELFTHLDAKVGRGNYVVALSADHGVVPIPEDSLKAGMDAGVLHIPEVQEKIERALAPFAYPKPVVARIANTDVYFSTGIYDRLKTDPAAMRAVLDGILSVEGTSAVYRAEEVQDRRATQNRIQSAEAASYFAGRSGDLFIVPKPYWLVSGAPRGKGRDYGTGHGTPYNYDQHVPILFMGWGILPGQYHGNSTPADIAPTLASLSGITLATPDGRVLAQALKTAGAAQPPAAAPHVQ